MNNKQILKKTGLFMVSFLVAALVVDGIYPDKSLEELSRLYLSDESEFVLVDGVNVHYRDEGNGPVVILLHGVNSSLHTWEGWVRELKTQYRVITLDLPGYGLTGPDIKERYGPEETADFLDKFVNTLGISQFVLGGNSRGGLVAWVYTMYHQEKVQKLILIDALGMPKQEPSPFIHRLQEFPVVSDLAKWITPKWMVSMAVSDIYGDPSVITDDLVQRYHDLLLREGNRDANIKVLSQTEKSLAGSRAIPTLNTETLIMWGEKDPWVPVGNAQLFHDKLPHSQLKIYPELGHVPMEEAPLATSADVLEFLGKGGRQAACCLPIGQVGG